MASASPLKCSTYLDAAPAWLINNPHRPPNDSVGDAAPSTIYAAAGQLTHTWEMVETTLMMLFAVLSGSTTAAPMIAFGSIIGSGARADMILAASTVSFLTTPDPNEYKQKALLKIINQSRRFGALRNVIAHGMVVRDAGGDIFEAVMTPTASSLRLVANQ